jgi:hypothetical protein
MHPLAGSKESAAATHTSCSSVPQPPVLLSPSASHPGVANAAAAADGAVCGARAWDGCGAPCAATTNPLGCDDRSPGCKALPRVCCASAPPVRARSQRAWRPVRCIASACNVAPTSQSWISTCRMLKELSQCVERGRGDPCICTIMCVNGRREPRWRKAKEESNGQRAVPQHTSVAVELLAVGAQLFKELAELLLIQRVACPRALPTQPSPSAFPPVAASRLDHAYTYVMMGVRSYAYSCTHSPSSAPR